MLYCSISIATRSKVPPAAVSTMSVAMPLTGPSSRTTLAVADRVGMFGSLLCALHCALMPLAFAALPALGLSIPLADIYRWTPLGPSEA